MKVLGVILLLLNLPITWALKFDIQAHPGHEATKYERCIRNFVAKDQLVVVTVTASGSKGDGQKLNLHVCAPHLYKASKGSAISLWPDRLT